MNTPIATLTAAGRIASALKVALIARREAQHSSKGVRLNVEIDPKMARFLDDLDGYWDLLTIPVIDRPDATSIPRPRAGALIVPRSAR